MANNRVTVFTFSDLNWVAKGGRISKAAAPIGSVLQINPVMQHINGKAVNRMIEMIKEKAN